MKKSSRILFAILVLANMISCFINIMDGSYFVGVFNLFAGIFCAVGWFIIIARNMDKNLACWLIGHKISNTTVSGYVFCTRCSWFEYYDRDEYSDGLLMIPIYFVVRNFHNLVNYIKNKFTKQDPDGLPF